MTSQLHDVLGRLGVTELLAVATGRDWSAGAGSELNVVCPIDGSRLASFASATRRDVATAVAP